MCLKSKTSKPKNSSQKYLKYQEEDIKACLRTFCLSHPGTNVTDILKKYFKDNSVKVPRTTFDTKFAQIVDVQDGPMSLQMLRTEVVKIFVETENVDNRDDFKRCSEIADRVLQRLYTFKHENMASQRKTLQQRNALLTADQEKYLVQLCKFLSYSGYGLQDPDVLECINIMAPSPDGRSHSQHALQNFFNRHPDLEHIKASGLDPKRASQANNTVCDVFFSKLDAYVQFLYAMGRSRWKNFADVPAIFKYNMDELGSDTTAHRSTVVGDAEKENIRLFTITPEGDKMPFHVTCCLTTRSDGQYSVPGDYIYDGAPPPVIIHSRTGDADPVIVADKLVSGLIDPKSIKGCSSMATANKSLNHYGFLVLATENGSMRQSTMFPYAKHFVDHLPSDRKPDEAVILFLDGHSSRWDVPSLEFFFKNNVFPYFLPSHTSIWSQPNDCGPNKRLHSCISNAVRKYRPKLVGEGKKYEPKDWNLCFRHAWATYLERERNGLLKDGSNSAKFAFAKTGIEPFHPRPSSWQTAIDTIGTSFSDANENYEKTYEIVPNESDAIKNLSDIERSLLTADYEAPKTFESEENCILLSARECGKHILHRWRNAHNLKRAELLRKNEEQESRLDPLVDCCDNIRKELEQIRPEDFQSTEKEAVALKIISFRQVDHRNLAKAPPKTLAEDQKQRKQSVLNQSALGCIIRLHRISTDDYREEITIFKTSATHWTLFEKNSTGCNMSQKDVTTDELIKDNNLRIYEQYDLTNCKEEDKKLLVDAQRRRNKAEELRRTSIATEKAKEKRNDMLREEYLKLVSIIKTGGHYLFQDFLQLEKKLTNPFAVNVLVDGIPYKAYANKNEMGAFNMMVNSIIRDTFFVQKRNNPDQESQQPKKKQKLESSEHLGRRQVPTKYSEDAITAIEKLVDFDERKQRKDLRKDLKKLQKDKDAIQKFMERVVTYKEKNPEGYCKVPDISCTKSQIVLMYRLFDGPTYSTKKPDEMIAYLNSHRIVVTKETTDRKIANLALSVQEINEKIQKIQENPLIMIEDFAGSEE